MSEEVWLVNACALELKLTEISLRHYPYQILVMSALSISALQPTNRLSPSPFLVAGKECIGSLSGPRSDIFLAYALASLHSCRSSDSALAPCLLRKMLCCFKALFSKSSSSKRIWVNEFYQVVTACWIFCWLEAVLFRNISLQ